MRRAACSRFLSVLLRSRFHCCSPFRTTEFVELPPSAYGVLWYSNVLCGVLRGALEMVQMRVEARFVKDVLQGDEVSEIR